ncbi:MULTISPECIES: hypothetical protein [unclassified Amycolatopsis]|uniref:hypothetical protein n=1 Tax=unclassified Amycolatopsis TaxID=2618356 RepID=UPI002E22E091|nr:MULTISPECIES: hypothetical protein [unclassified Amycolatopsis]
MPRRRVPEPATGGTAGRVFLPVMLVLFGLGTAVVLIAQSTVLADELGHGGETSPWPVLALLASAVQLAGVLAVGFRRRWGAKVFAVAFLAGALLDLGHVTGASALLIIGKIVVAGLLAAAILVRWDDLAA